tara:strand:- start:53 stop:1222 length:1170 start_codon:yes stop_codon:yes gene_type:complete
MDFINYKRKKNKNGIYYYYKVDKNNKKIIISKNEYVHNKNNIKCGGAPFSRVSNVEELRKKKKEEIRKIKEFYNFWNYNNFTTYISRFFFNNSKDIDEIWSGMSGNSMSENRFRCSDLKCHIIKFFLNHENKEGEENVDNKEDEANVDNKKGEENVDNKEDEEGEENVDNKEDEEKNELQNFFKPDTKYIYEHEILKKSEEYDKLVDDFFQIQENQQVLKDKFIKPLKKGHKLRIEISIQNSNAELNKELNEELKEELNEELNKDLNKIIILLETIKKEVRKKMYKVGIFISIHHMTPKEGKFKYTLNNHHFIILYNPKYSEDNDICIIQTWEKMTLYTKIMGFDKYICKLKKCIFNKSNIWEKKEIKENKKRKRNLNINLNKQRPPKR